MQSTCERIGSYRAAPLIGVPDAKLHYMFTGRINAPERVVRQCGRISLAITR